MCQKVHGKLHLVDLAGSERQGKALTVGTGALESKHINRVNILKSPLYS
jgi:hypothetical protein